MLRPNYKQILIPIALSVCACDSGQTPTPTSLSVPDDIRRVAAIQSENLVLQIQVNNRPPQVLPGQGLQDNWTVTIKAPGRSTNTIRITWLENYEEERIVLASQSASIQTGDETTFITLDGQYTTSGQGFDFDSDGRSNLVERQIGTNPLVADAESFIPNEPETVFINGACFDLGSPDSEAGRDSSEDFYSACVNDYAIGKYEVTFEQYDQFATITGRAKPDDEGWGRGAMPVTNVSWQEATDYAQWLSEITNKNYRLPKEHEWEYAARAGTTTAFNTGNTLTEDQANFNASVSYNGAPVGGRSTQSRTVGSYGANSWGIYDMHGNQSEWTCSRFTFFYSAAATTCESFGVDTDYTIRGGSWSSPAAELRSAHRFRDEGIRRYFYVGFRVVLEQ